MTPNRLKCMNTIVRTFSTKPTTNGNIQPMIYNRNPRNLERLRLDLKPTGYALENLNVEFWHRLDIKRQHGYATVQLVHNSDKVVVSASTKEWAIRKFLYSGEDRQAYIVLGKVFAERCIESGITTFSAKHLENESLNIQALFNTLKEEGLIIDEPKQFDYHENPWLAKPEKAPWTVLED